MSSSKSALPSLEELRASLAAKGAPVWGTREQLYERLHANDANDASLPERPHSPPKRPSLALVRRAMVEESNRRAISEMKDDYQEHRQMADDSKARSRQKEQRKVDEVRTFKADAQQGAQDRAVLASVRARQLKEEQEELRRAVAQQKEADLAALARFQEEFGPQPRAERMKQVSSEQATQKAGVRAERRANSEQLRSRGAAEEKERLDRNHLLVSRVRNETT